MGKRYRCVNEDCDEQFDDADKAREHELSNDLHWITDTQTNHIVSFNETANRSVDLLPADVPTVDSVEDINPEEYKVYGERAECLCGETFDTHEEGLEHLETVRSGGVPVDE